MSIIATPWTRQPAVAVGVDQSGYARGAVAAVIGVLPDSVSRNGLPAFSGIMAAARDSGGIHTIGSGISPGTVVWNCSQRSVSGDFTFLTVVDPSASDLGGWYTTHHALNSGGSLLFRFTANVDSVLFEVTGGTNMSGSISSTSRRPYVFAGVYRDGRAEVWRGGQFIGSAASSVSVSFTLDRLIDGREGGASSIGGIRTYARLLIPRALNGPELAALGVNPWQLFAPLPRRYWSGFAAGGSTYEVAVSESASASESLSAIQIVVVVVSESAAPTSIEAATSALAAASNEAASATDSQAATASLVGAVDEAASAADAQSTGATSAADAEEAASATDATSGTLTLSGIATEAASAADVVSTAAELLASLSETLSATDQVAVTAVLLADVSEAVSAADATNWGGAIYSVELVETGSASEAISAGLLALAEASESASAGDAVVVVLTAVADQAEAASAADTAAAALQLIAALSESASAADAVAGSLGGTAYAVDVAEAISAADLVVAVIGTSVVIYSTAPVQRAAPGAARRPQLASAQRPGQVQRRNRLS